MIEFDAHITWFYFLLPVFLYAEIHYRIWNLFSRYFKREPEIVADVPHRVGPGKKLPVFLCIKDAHRFSIILKSVQVRCVSEKSSLTLFEKDFENWIIEIPFWYELFHIDLAKISGDININVSIIYICRGKEKTCVNDNYKLTSHAPFTVYSDNVSRPRLHGWFFGDMHTHSHFSNDQVEFGAPFEVTAVMARAVELDFFASADHSYDLDDRIDDYLVNDPKLPKWKMMWEQIGSFNKKNKDMLIIPGEELSAGNSKNQNVHYLILNNKKFWHGWGDSAEKWFRTKPQHKISEVLPQLENDAVSFAAHPIIQPPYVQKLLIRRGMWTDQDLTRPGLHGAQFWNGDKNHFLNVGLQKWIDLLLNGHKIILIAGTDAHGNFNRFRQIGTPHVSMREEHCEIFGTSVTGVQIDGELSLDSILDGLRKGRVLVTDGPTAALSFQLSSVSLNDYEKRDTQDEINAKGNIVDQNLKVWSRSPEANREQFYYIGDTLIFCPGTVNITAASSRSYGEVHRIELIFGDISLKKETRKQINLPSGLYEISENVKLETCSQPGYIRMETETRIGDRSYHCFTNPIFFD